jgi:WD40 repeat protein
LGKNIGELNGHKSGVRHIALTNDGKSLISVGMDNQIILWKLQNNNNTIIKTYSLDMIPPIESIYYFTRTVNANNNPDGTGKDLIPTLLTGCEDGSLLELNLKKATINDLSIRANFIAQPINQINYFPQMKKLICVTTEQTFIYLDLNIVNNKITEAVCQKIIPGYCQEILDVKILPGNFLNNSKENSKENFEENENKYNTINNNDINDIYNDNHNDNDNNNNNKINKAEIYKNIEYIFSSNDNSLKYLSKNKVKLFEGHSDFIMNIDIKNNYISTSSKDNTIRIWNFIHNTQGEFLCKCIAILKGHSEVVNSSALILKKNYQIVSVSRDKSIKLWDFSDLIEESFNKENTFENMSEPFIIDDAKFSEIPHDEEINMVKVSPNEKIIATCSYDKTIKIFTKKLEEIGTLKGHRRAVMDICFSKYAKLIASTSSDKTIKIWNLTDFTCIKTFEGHLAGTIKVAWIYYGTHLISCKKNKIK